MRLSLVRPGMLAALLITMLPYAAHAQSPIQENTWFVTGSAGVAVGSNDSDTEASFTLSGAAAYPVTPSVVIEGELGHVLDLAPDEAGVDASMTTVHGSLLYLLNTSYKLTPYLAGGLGAGKYSVSTPAADASATEFGFNLGAGVLYPLSSGTSVRGDFRVFKHIDNLPTVWRFTGGIAVRIGS